MAGITVREPLFNESWTDDQSLIRRPQRFRVKPSLTRDLIWTALVQQKLRLNRGQGHIWTWFKLDRRWWNAPLSSDGQTRYYYQQYSVNTTSPFFIFQFIHAFPQPVNERFLFLLELVLQLHFVLLQLHNSNNRFKHSCPLHATNNLINWLIPRCGLQTKQNRLAVF